MTVCRFINTTIDAQRSAASLARGDMTENKGHTNYDVSDVLVKARTAPTTGSGCVMTCCQIFFFGSRVHALMAAL